MTLKIDPKLALDMINNFIDRVDELLKMNYREGTNKKSELDSEIQGFLTSAFENGGNKGYTSSPAFFAAVVGHIPSEKEKQDDYISSLNRMKKHLIRFRSEVNTRLSTEIVKGEAAEIVIEDNIFDVLELIFSRFHTVVRELRKRYGDKPTLNVEDEHDAQDLLRSILYIHFLDIRPEESTISYAGNHRKMDFLLGPEKTVIEVKMACKNHTNKQISEELHDDIATYKTHPSCDTLVCFVYDPDGWVSNPVGFETDLGSQNSDKLKVKAYIFPKN